MQISRQHVHIPFFALHHFLTTYQNHFHLISLSLSSLCSIIPELNTTPTFFNNHKTNTYLYISSIFSFIHQIAPTCKHRQHNSLFVIQQEIENLSNNYADYNIYMLCSIILCLPPNKTNFTSTPLAMNVHHLKIARKQKKQR